MLNMTIIRIYYLLFQKKARLYLTIPMNKMYITFKSKDMFSKIWVSNIFFQRSLPYNKITNLNNFS